MQRWSARKRLRTSRRNYPAIRPRKRETRRPETARLSKSGRRPSEGHCPRVTRPAGRGLPGVRSGRPAPPVRPRGPHVSPGAVPPARRAVPGRGTPTGGEPRGPLPPKARSRSRTSRTLRAPPARTAPPEGLALVGPARGPRPRPAPRRPVWRAPGCGMPACGSTTCAAPTATRSCAASVDDDPRGRPAPARSRPRGPGQPPDQAWS